MDENMSNPFEITIGDEQDSKTMSKRITVSLTEDQAWLLLEILEETVLDEDGFVEDYTAEQRAFAKRLKTKITKQILAQAKR